MGWSACFGMVEEELRGSIIRLFTYIRDRTGGIGRDRIIVPSKFGREIFPRLFDTFERGQIILALDAVHAVANFMHEVLQRL